MNKYLIQYDGDRQNNFTAIRLFLAWAVLYGHSFPVQGTLIKDPLHHVFQGSTWIGDVAVNGFFAISGFLVCASFIKRGVFDYTVSRALRIFPALIVCVLVSVFLFGLLLTTLGPLEYLQNSTTYDYLWNMFVFLDTRWNLPGVFEGNTRSSVNGSLWTLPVEARCYLALAILGVFGLFLKRQITNVLMIGIFLFGYFYFMETPLLGQHEMWARPAMFFLIGVFFYVNRGDILLDIRLAGLSFAAIIFSFGEPWFNFILPLCYVYILFYIAYCSKYLKLDESIGDISYGVYIYAWPIQQIFATLFPQSSPYMNVMVCTVVTAVFAYLSWKYVERPSLSLKKKLLSF